MAEIQNSIQNINTSTDELLALQLAFEDHILPSHTLIQPVGNTHSNLDGLINLEEMSEIMQHVLNDMTLPDRPRHRNYYSNEYSTSTRNNNLAHHPRHNSNRSEHTENSNQDNTQQYNPYEHFNFWMGTVAPIRNNIILPMPILRIFGLLGESIDQSDVALPVTEQTFKNMQEVAFKDIRQYITADLPEKCSICVDLFKPDDVIKILPCKHFFHKDCIAEWLTKYHHVCPLCRQSTGEHTHV